MSDERWSDEPPKKIYVDPSKTINVFRNKPKWRSVKAPGTPPGWEALFKLIELGDTTGHAFNGARRHYCKFTDEQVWAFYASWLCGEVHEDLKKEGEI